MFSYLNFLLELWRPYKRSACLRDIIYYIITLLGVIIYGRGWGGANLKMISCVTPSHRRSWNCKWSVNLMKGLNRVSTPQNSFPSSWFGSSNPTELQVLFISHPNDLASDSREFISPKMFFSISLEVASEVFWDFWCTIKYLSGSNFYILMFKVFEWWCFDEP